MTVSEHETIEVGSVGVEGTRRDEGRYDEDDDDLVEDVVLGLRM